ncbi:MAG: hypothetical protein II411_02420, partial [Lachnospiraceae bacterium]|nr:hypothetical protein [Lachnospiraceae bacterium]
MSGNLDNVFVQTSGTKFNTESRVYGIAFKSAASGTVMKWTNETVNEAELDMYSTCFTADTYMIEDYVVRRQGDYAVIVSSEDHTHRPCGVGRNEACKHTEIASHSEAYTYVKIGTSSLENVDTFIKTFEGNSSHGTGSGALYVYLAADIIVTTVKTITPVRPVYLCLNGHLMSGFRFLGSNQVTITNCKKTQATFREILDTNICFQSNTYLYGIDRNLTINTSRIMDIGGSYGATNTEALFYGVIFDGTGMNTGSGSVNSKFYFNKNNARATFENCMFTNFKRQARMFWFHGGNANSNIIFKDVDVATNSGTDYQLLYSDVAAINIAFKGRNRFWNNTMQGTNETARVIDFSTGKVTIEGEGLFVENNKTLGSKYLVFFYSNADFLLKEGATLRIKDNVFTNKTTSGSVNYFVEFNAGCNPKLYGNFEVIGNKLGNCGTDNSKYVSALKFAVENPIEIGGGRIIVKDNKSYKDSALTTLADESTYPAQHMFQLLSFAKTHPLFAMKTGQKLNPESKIDGVAFYYASGTGKLLEWDSATYGTDSYHENVFIPDRFFNDYLGEGVVNGYASLKYATPPEEKHDHKVCGRALSDACTHTEVAAHTKNIEYQKIGTTLKNNLDIFTYLMSSADKIPEDDMYFYLDEDIVSSKTRNITLRNNIYICLNGHKMSGFTFNTANGNTLYITNCASGVGRIEHTLSDSGIMFRLSTEIYGINRNLVPKSGSLIAHEAKNVVFYDTLFDNDGRISNPGTTIIHTSTTGASFIIEKCKFVNFEKGLEMLKTSTNNATVILKNTEFEKCNNMASRFFQMYNNTSSRNKLIFKGENSIHDCVSTTENASSGAAFHFGYSDVTIESGGSLKYYNNQFKTANRNCIMWFDNSKLNIAENASLEMTDNLMYQFKGSSDVTILLGISQNSNTVNVYGNLKITDNIVSNCTNKTTKYMAALDLRGGVINIGNGVITVNNNKSGKNADGTGDVDASVRGYHMFNLYSANISNIFTVKSGSKINLNSRVDATFYDSTDGKVMLWNSNTTSDLNAYSTIFTTDSYGDEEGLEVFFKNGYAIVESKDNNHIHKLCGVASNSNCTHSLISNHTTSQQYVRITQSTSADKLVTTLQGDATSDSTLYYFLKRDYNVTSEKVVTLKKDLYLCLNGYSLTGFRFAGNGRKLYICNCKENKKVSVGSKLSGNITFATGVHVYGQNKNITVVSGRVCDMTATYNNQNVSFYSVNVDGNSSNYASKEFAVFYIEKASSVLNIEDCDFYGHKKFHSFFSPQITSTINLKNSTFRDMSNCVKSYLNLWKDKNKQVTMNLYGDIKFDNISLSGSSTTNVPANQLSGCNFNVKSKATVSFTRWSVSNYREMFRFSTNAKFTVEEGANFIVDNNVLNKTDVTNENNAIIAYHNDSTVSCNILGNFKLTNNKINNCGTKKNGTSLAAFYIERNAAGPVTIGKGKIEIYNNNSYKDNGKTIADDKTYTNHHMFGVYATNKTLIFAQKAGTKLNGQSYIENVAFSTPDYSGTVVKWTTNEVNAEDIGRFNKVFVADPYWDDELWTEEKNNNGVIAFGAPNHKHKLCGVATTSACLHDSIVDHTEVIGYRKISSMYTTSAEIKTLLQTGGAYVLTADIEIEKLTGTDKYLNVTPAKDLYICLNGHSFKGIIFTGGTNYTVYVTNCQNTKAKFGNAAVANPAFNNISGEIYGINKNIEVFYDRLANLTGAEAAKQRIRVHSATFTKGLGSAITDPYIYIASKSANSSFIDDCDFSGLNTHSFIRSVGERTFKMKNTTIKDMVTTNYLMHFDSGATVADFDGNNIIENIKYSNKSGDFFIHFGSYAANKVTINGNLSITNCESYYNTNHFFHISGGHVTIDDNSKLTINNNRLYNTAIYGRALLYLGNNADFNLYGDLEIKDNAFKGTRQSHSDAGLWYANSTKPIIIGSTSIVISNNTTTNARANVRNLYSYSERIFNQKAGTKLNALNTMIDSIAINSEDYTGVIYPIWDDSNVVGFDDVNFVEIFKADVYGGRKGIITARDGDKIIITFGDHFHKTCGTLAT